MHLDKMTATTPNSPNSYIVLFWFCFTLSQILIYTLVYSIAPISQSNYHYWLVSNLGIESSFQAHKISARTGLTYPIHLLTSTCMHIFDLSNIYIKYLYIYIYKSEV